MDRYDFARNRTQVTFVASTPKSVTGEAATPPSVRSFGTYLAAIPRVSDPKTTDVRRVNRTFALLIIATIGLAVVPDMITYLSVEHQPIVPPGQALPPPDIPLAQLASLGGSALLLGLSTLAVLMRGYSDRDIAGVLVLLLAVNLPYVTSPELLSPADLPKIVLANVFVLALWNLGAPISGLKWLPITVAAISVYSLIGGLVSPKYMMYNLVSEKAIVAGWELAGPFGHANVLGMFCGLAFALTPLITERRWRIICGSILFATVLASASRTAVIAAALAMLWWLLCWFRPMISIRPVGTVLVSVTAAAMFVFPFVHWNPDAFTDRAHVWAESLKVWRQSPVVGMGVNWFLTDAQASGNIAKWAFVGTGHNMVVDTLVKSGLLGLAVLVPLLLAAIVGTRALPVVSQQIACFGFLMAFFVTATTEAVWAILPNLQLFPISALVFAVLIVTRRDGEGIEAPS